jgi:hypothetical protein
MTNAERFIARSADKKLVLGPVLCGQFVVAGADARGFWCELVEGDTNDLANLALEIMLRSKGFTMQVMEDQFDAAEMCRKLWPCDRTNRIAESVRASRSVKHQNETARRNWPSIERRYS